MFVEQLKECSSLSIKKREHSYPSATFWNCYLPPASRLPCSLELSSPSLHPLPPLQADFWCHLDGFTDTGWVPHHLVNTHSQYGLLHIPVTRPSAGGWCLYFPAFCVTTASPPQPPPSLFLSLQFPPRLSSFPYTLFEHRSPLQVSHCQLHKGSSPSHSLEPRCRQPGNICELKQAASSPASGS